MMRRSLRWDAQSFFSFHRHTGSLLRRSAPVFDYPSMKTRRESLKLALGGLAAAAGAVAPAQSTAPIATRIIDTHTHFYDPTRPQGVPWPAQGSPLYRPVYPADWAAVAGKHGIRETVVVEASNLLEDNDWILNLAAKEKSIVGFVGNLQPADHDFAANLKRLAANPIFRGIRVGGKNLANGLVDDVFLSGLKLMADLGLALDVNGVGDPALIASLAGKVSGLRIVIDHCGNCGDPQKLKQGWKEGMAACAQAKNVYCKVSALAEMADAPVGMAPTDTAYYLPILDVLWERFGADRVIYGSNWPVSDKGGNYDVVFGIVREYFRTKGSEACEKYFWKNSLAAYKWVGRV